MIDVLCEDKRLAETLADAATWALAKFIEEPSEIDVTIEVVEELQQKASGVVHMDIDGEFHVEIAFKPIFKDMIKTLMHEMVHVKQYALGELQISLKMNGESFQVSRIWHDEIFDYDGTDYFDLPWEIEAFGREHGMMVQWARQTDKLEIEEA